MHKESTRHQHLSRAAFCNRVQEYLRAAGFSQNQLADILGLHPKVLSRKFNGSSNAHFTLHEVRAIVMALAQWTVISTQDEAVQLLELAQLKRNSFSLEEWQARPLNRLEGASTLCAPALPVAPAPPGQARHNLPAPVTGLIGRARAAEQLRRLLGREDVRLISLVGPGGSGKTRLALHVAREVIDTAAQDVWWVSLAEVSDSALVPQHITRALGIGAVQGVSPLQSLANVLGERHLLLILDNFEQVASAAPFVGELLAAVPRLKALVTSRAALHLYGEHVLNVAPLDVPDLSTITACETLEHSSAIQLFVARAQATETGFTLTAENALTVARICARIDGLPLALELAAAHIKLMTPAMLLHQLETSCLTTLTGGPCNLPARHQALRCAMAWSYHLLHPREQALFRRLAVFSGGWMAVGGGAIEYVCFTAIGDEERVSSIQEGVASLLDKSLLVPIKQAGCVHRVMLLHTIRDYGLECLHECGEAEAIRQYHALYYLVYAARLERCRSDATRSESTARALTMQERLQQEQENIRSAILWLMVRPGTTKAMLLYWIAACFWMREAR